MLLNLGITADAAAAHRHEFSASPDVQQEDAAFFPSARSILALGFASLTKQGGGVPYPATGNTPPMAQSSIYQSIVGSSSVIFQEPMPIEKASGHTGSGSETPDTTENSSTPSSPSRKQSPRSKTVLRFAHPPPTTRPKRLRIRPRLLLQLQQVSNTARPISTLDVVPSSFLKGCSPRKLPGAFAGRDRLCPTDFIVLPSETHEPLSSGYDDKNSPTDSPSDHRDPIATICHVRKDDSKSRNNVEIHFTSGLRWTSEFLPKGGYQFTAVDEHGIKKCVRWVVRSRKCRSSSGQSSGQQSPNSDDGRRLTFSIIDPETRRHPVIGWLCCTGIEVLEKESLLAIYASRKADGKSVASRCPFEIDNNIQQLITITGIWAAFQEGWAGNSNATLNESLSNGHNTNTLPSLNIVPAPEPAPDTITGGFHPDSAPDHINNRHSITSRILHVGRRSMPARPSSSSQKYAPRRSCSDDGVSKKGYPSTPTHARSCSMLCVGSHECSPQNYPHRPVAVHDLTDYDLDGAHDYSENIASYPFGQAPGYCSRSSIHTAPSPISGSNSPNRAVTPTPEHSLASSASSKDKSRWRKLGGMLDAVRVKKETKFRHSE